MFSKISYFFCLLLKIQPYTVQLYYRYDKYEVAYWQNIFNAIYSVEDSPYNMSNLKTLSILMSWSCDPFCKPSTIMIKAK